MLQQGVSSTVCKNMNIFISGASGNVGIEVLKCLLHEKKKNALLQTSPTSSSNANEPSSLRRRRRRMNLFAGVRQINASTISKFHKELFNNDPSIQVVQPSENQPFAIFKHQRREDAPNHSEDDLFLIRIMPFDFKQECGGEVFKAMMEGKGINEWRMSFQESDDACNCGYCCGGFHRLFLMRPPDLSNIQRDMKPFLGYITTSSTTSLTTTTPTKTYSLPELIVFMSVLGANKMVPHFKMEQILMEHSKQVPYVFLRPSFFMQNLTTTHLREIRDESQLFMPAGNGSTSFIDVRDIAQVTCQILMEENCEKFANKAFDLTGSEALTYFEVARKLSEACGRSIVYANPSIPKFMYRTWKNNPDLPFSYLMVATALYTGK